MDVCRVGIIGDVHGQAVTLTDALARLAEIQELDQILCTGDILGGDGDWNACCELLRDADVLCVRGNHERWYFETEPFHAELIEHADPADLVDWPIRLSDMNREFLAALPPTREFQIHDGAVLLCHGLGENDMAGVYPADDDLALDRNEPLLAILRRNAYRFVVCGHTHHRLVRRIGGLILINAGSLLEDPRPCVAIVDFVTCEIEFKMIYP